MRAVHLFALGTALLAGASPLTAQQVRGRLVNAETGAPIPGGSLVLIAADRSVAASTTADSLGHFALTAPEPGGFRLRGEHEAHRPALSMEMRLAREDTMEVEFRLSRRVVLLDPLVVQGESRRVSPVLRGYYARLERGSMGRRVTRETIERMRVSHTSDLLRMVPGVQVMGRAVGGGAAVSLRGCAPKLYLDGVRVRVPGVTVDDLARPGDLEGIEVFGNASDVPVELGGANGTCGAIVLWTRRM